jgi:hypothetical protein
MKEAYLIQKYKHWRETSKLLVVRRQTRGTITQVLALRYRNVLMIPEVQKETGRVVVLREPDGSLIGTRTMLEVDGRMATPWRIGVMRLVETLRMVTVGRAPEIEEGTLTIQMVIPVAILETTRALLRSLVVLLILHAISTS